MSEFKVGDIVEGLKSASGPYQYTKEGSRLQVTAIVGSKAFKGLLLGGIMKGREYTVISRHFKKVGTAPKPAKASRPSPAAPFTPKSINSPSAPYTPKSIHSTDDLIAANIKLKSQIAAAEKRIEAKKADFKRNLEVIKFRVAAAG